MIKFKAVRAAIDGVGRWSGPLIVTVAGLAMLIWTWRSWPDPLIDFGQQLYVPWRMAEGDVLYRDIAYHYGPLSPWINSIVFRLFGVGLTSLIAFNLAILAGLIVLLYRIFSLLAGAVSATLACLIFLTVFAFGQLVEYGNYNFVCPYVHGVTHGVVLSLLAIHGLSSYFRETRLITIGGIGFTVGLLFLTKAEIFLAGVLAVVCGLVVCWRFLALPFTRLVRHASVFVGCAILPPLLSFAALWLRMPGHDALYGTLGAWPAILNGDVLGVKMYRWSLGTDDLRDSLELMVRSCLWYGGMLLPPALLGLALRGHRRNWIWPAVVTFVAVTAFLGRSRIWWPDAVRLLPVVMLVLAAAGLPGLLGRRPGRLELARRVVLVAMIVFATGLLARIGLFARTFHYGFALAMPATLLAAVAAFEWLPAAIARRSGNGRPSRAAALAVLLSLMLGHLLVTSSYLERKTEWVASDRDAFRADQRGAYVNEMLEDIALNVPTDATLLVLPAGVMLNYLSRRPSPSPYIYFMPSDLLLYGETAVSERLRSSPPDFVVLVHKDTEEFGARFFGRDYGIELGSWIRSNYQTVTVLGAHPLEDERFGMSLMRRIPSPGDSD